MNGIGLALAFAVSLTAYSWHALAEAHSSGTHAKVEAIFKEAGVTAEGDTEEASTRQEGLPKEIFIYCSDAPTVKVVDLDPTYAAEHDECLVMNFAGPDVSSRLVLRCNDTLSGFG